MAVTITTKFYQAVAWKDLSKIVFTSPNMTSPNTVGTRSHIFPGGAIPLGLWYEDLSNMYRIEDDQTEATSNYLDYKVELKESLNFDSPPTWLTVSGINQTDIIYQVRDYTGTSVNYTEISYDPTFSGSNMTVKWSSGGSPEGAFTNYWYALSADCPTQPWDMTCWWQTELAVPRRICGVTFTYISVPSTNQIDDYEIQAKLNASDDWTSLYSATDITGEDQALFHNDKCYKYYRLYMTAYTSMGYSLKDLVFYDYGTVTDGTKLKTFYIDAANKIYVDNIDVISNTNQNFKLKIDSVGPTSSGTVASGTLCTWGHTGSIDVDVENSTVFEATFGECYDCRLTAWDDVTHSSTLNEILMGYHCRVSAMVYTCKGSKLAPTENDDTDNIIHWPVYNRIFKGNTTYLGTPCYYGDFDMRFRSDPAEYGDYLIFKPMLYGIHGGISYGVHDFLITLHYSYT